MLAREGKNLGETIAFQRDRIDHRPRLLHLRQRRSQCGWIGAVDAKGEVGSLLCDFHQPAQKLSFTAWKSSTIDIDIMSAGGSLTACFCLYGFCVKLFEGGTDRLARRIDTFCDNKHSDTPPRPFSISLLLIWPGSVGTSRSFWPSPRRSQACSSQ